MAQQHDMPLFSHQKDNGFILFDVNRDDGKIEAQISGNAVHITCVKKENTDALEKSKAILLATYLTNTA